jgi:hypothetical protein
MDAVQSERENTGGARMGDVPVAEKWPYPAPAAVPTQAAWHKIRF